MHSGHNLNETYLNSFERISLTGLQPGSESWELMPIPSEYMLPKVISFAAVSYNDKEIAIIKGDKKEGTLNYALHVYDTTKTVDCWRKIFKQGPVLNSKNHNYRIMLNQSALVAKEHIILLAIDVYQPYFLEIKGSA